LVVWEERDVKFNTDNTNTSGHTHENRIQTKKSGGVGCAPGPSGKRKLGECKRDCGAGIGKGKSTSKKKPQRL